MYNVSKFGEFHVVCGLCGWTAWNLRSSLEFLRVLCRGRPLKHNINRLIIGANFAQIAEYVGELSEFCLICLNFAKVQNGNEKFCCKFKMNVYS